MTIKEFLAACGITMRATSVPHRPDSDDWSPGSKHWLCTFKRHRVAGKPLLFSVFFSQGSAHTKPPTAEDVMDCLASDLSSYNNCRTFEEWCAELGFDDDSRKAMRTFKAVACQAKQLRDFLSGVDVPLGETTVSAMEALNLHTERL